MKTIFHIIIEGTNEEQMIKLFEEIQNKYDLYDNCILESCEVSKTIIDDRKEETGILEV